MALLDLLLKRRSSREFCGRELNLYMMSRLLWAAFGFNRPAEGRRTAPSAQDGQEIDIYVALATGLFRFDARELVLVPVLGEDVRAATGEQDFVEIAPVNLVFVARLDPDAAASHAEQEFYAALDTGYISENVYLFCAAEGLATVARGMLDRPALARKMGLAEHQRIILAQSVGYPPERE
jgi:nitroreductase